jgi:hypothetical protein
METFTLVLCVILGVSGFLILLSDKEEEKYIQELFRNAREHLDKNKDN